MQCSDLVAMVRNNDIGGGGDDDHLKPRNYHFHGDCVGFFFLSSLPPSDIFVPRSTVQCSAVRGQVAQIPLRNAKYGTAAF